MMKKYLGNAMSLQMISSFPAKLDIQEVSKEEEALNPENVSVVGHPDTAAVLGVEFNRTNVLLSKGDILYVAQLQGGRLPQGATTLPDGFSFRFLKVTVE